MSSVSSAAGIPATTETLDQDEQTVFDRIFSRNFVFQNIYKEWQEILMRHKDEINASAAIAKGQFGVRFGGLSPSGSQFGMTLTRSPFFGLSTWDLNAAAYAAVSGTTLTPGVRPAAGVNNWIDARVIANGAVAGTAITIGRFAVHCICAVGDFSSSPVIESFQETLNGNQQPVLAAEHQFRNSQLHLMELDESEIYKLNTTTQWSFNADTAANTDSPYFFGVSFLPFTQIKFLNPSTFNGGTATDSVVHI